MSACLTENTVVDALEGGLSAPARAELEAHVAGCERCRHLMEMMATSIALPGAAPANALAAAGSVDPSLPGAAQGARLPEPGALVGRYVIERVIGGGGMGVVYAARDPELDRAVAIKLIRPELDAVSETVQRRLVRESRAMAQLAHPNVLAVHDVGRFEGQVFIAMELAAGGTLSEWLAAERRGWRDIVARFCLAGRGLQAAHATGLVHRDFKPDNVLLTGDGGVRVADFGLVGSGSDEPAASPGSIDSMALDQTGRPSRGLLTRTGARLGTPLYMAPEQHHGRRVGPAADQFAFAVALYEALHGQHPFETGSYVQLVAAIDAGRVREAPERSDVPPGVREILLRALRVDAQDRWPSMAALLDALDRHLSASAQIAEPSEPEVRAQVAELRQRLDRARVLAEAGKYAEALPVARQVSDEAAAVGYTPVRAEALSRLGLLEIDAGDLRAAEKTLSEAAVQAARARDDALAARIWCDLLVLVGHRQGRGAEAQLLRPAAEAALARCGDDLALQARFMNSLGIVLIDAGRYRESRDSFHRAAELYEQAFGPYDLLLGTTHNNLGCTLHRLGAYQESRDHHLRAREIWLHVLDRDHPQLAFSLNNLGEVEHEEGNLDEAAALHEQALAMRERVLRADHPFIALSLYNLAATRHQQGRYEEALALHERALRLRNASLGADHPDVAESLGGVGAALVALGRAAEALPHHERALAIIEKALGADHARVAARADDMGDALTAVERWEAACVQHERALAIIERALDPEHPHAARSLAGLARARLGLGQPAAAEAAASRALAIAEKGRAGEVACRRLRALVSQARASISGGGAST